MGTGIVLLSPHMVVTQITVKMKFLRLAELALQEAESWTPSLEHGGFSVLIVRRGIRRREGDRLFLWSQVHTVSSSFPHGCDPDWVCPFSGSSLLPNVQSRALHKDSL